MVTVLYGVVGLSRALEAVGNSLRGFLPSRWNGGFVVKTSFCGSAYSWEEAIRETAWAAFAAIGGSAFAVMVAKYKAATRVKQIFGVMMRPFQGSSSSGSASVKTL